MKVDFQFPPCRTYSASKRTAIDLTVLWDYLRICKDLHGIAKNIHYAVIRCLTWFYHGNGNYFTRITNLAIQSIKTGDSQPLDVKTGGIQPKLNVACFVQSCFAVANFVIFSNYCLIGTRLYPCKTLISPTTSSPIPIRTATSAATAAATSRPPSRRDG